MTRMMDLIPVVTADRRPIVYLTGPEMARRRRRPSRYRAAPDARRPREFVKRGDGAIVRWRYLPWGSW